MEPQWADAQGDIGKLDHVRVATGLFAGKVGQVIDLSGKGKLKVALGDGGVAIDLPRDAVTKVVAAPEAG